MKHESFIIRKGEMKSGIDSWQARLYGTGFVILVVILIVTKIGVDDIILFSAIYLLPAVVIFLWRTAQVEKQTKAMVASKADSFRKAGLDKALSSSDKKEMVLFDDKAKRMAIIARASIFSETDRGFHETIETYSFSYDEVKDVTYIHHPDDLQFKLSRAESAASSDNTYALGGALVGGAAGFAVGGAIDVIKDNIAGGPKIKRDRTFSLKFDFKLVSNEKIRFNALADSFGANMNQRDFIGLARNACDTMQEYILQIEEHLPEKLHKI
jgi:hypothetical protein